ncbi:MAG: hypothetical protein IANPNBLG_01226 [Bryobacteraceae bacterium]|nr:hypothetical protein [Bryobacteraceae bacterium]MCC6343439.1 hypothetical protein [Bryobacterales bacterium]
MIRSLFSIYGLLIAGFVGYSQWRGWSLDRVNEVRNVPKSIRDNPGAWRSHYGGGIGRYYGGK